MDRLLIMQTYEEETNCFVYSVRYALDYRVPENTLFDGIETMIKNNIRDGVINDFQKLNLETDVDIIEWF